LDRDEGRRRQFCPSGHSKTRVSGLLRAGHRVSIVTEVGSFSPVRESAIAMRYGGMVFSEVRSPNRARRGAITKTGDAHLRGVIEEAECISKSAVGRVPAQTTNKASITAANDIGWKV